MTKKRYEMLMDISTTQRLCKDDELSFLLFKNSTYILNWRDCSCLNEDYKECFQVYIAIEELDDEFLITLPVSSIYHEFIIRNFQKAEVKDDVINITRKHGTTLYKLNGRLHRADAPAVEWDNGYKEWWFNGKRHRTDGHAVEYPDGDKEWWLDGIQYTEDFKAKIED